MGSIAFGEELQRIKKIRNGIELDRIISAYVYKNGEFKEVWGDTNVVFEADINNIYSEIYENSRTIDSEMVSQVSQPITVYAPNGQSRSNSTVAYTLTPLALSSYNYATITFAWHCYINYGNSDCSYDGTVIGSAGLGHTDTRGDKVIKVPLNNIGNRIMMVNATNQSSEPTWLAYSSVGVRKIVLSQD